MDLEMTGLDPNVDVIVEIATVITDDFLNTVAEGPDLVVGATAEQLEKMEEAVVLVGECSVDQCQDRGDIALDGAPDDVRLHQQVPVRDAIAHAPHRRPCSAEEVCASPLIQS